MKKFAFVPVAALFSLLLAGCPDPLPPQPPQPPLPDAGEVDGGENPSTPCAAMCANLDAKDCRGSDGRRLADPTPGGVPCVDSCERYESEDLGIDMNPECQAAAKSCAAAQACPK